MAKKSFSKMARKEYCEEYCEEDDAVDEKPFRQPSEEELDDQYVYGSSQTISPNSSMTSPSPSSTCSAGSTRAEPGTPRSPIPETSQLSTKYEQLKEEMMALRKQYKELDTLNNQLYGDLSEAQVKQKESSCNYAHMMTSLDQEKMKRLKAEQEVANLKKWIKNSNEKSAQLAKRVKRSCTEGKDLLIKMQKEQITLQLEADEMDRYWGNTMKMTESQNTGTSAAPPTKNIQIPKTTVNLKILPPQPTNEDAVEVRRTRVPCSKVTKQKDGGHTVISQRKNLAHGYARGNGQHPPFFCTCESSYNSFQSLRNHINYKKEDPRYRCKICGHCFPYRCYLANHMKGAHKMEPDADLVKFRSTKRPQGRRPRRTIKSPIERASKRALKIERDDVEVDSESTDDITNQSFQHREVASDFTDKHACSCGNKYSRKPTLLKHIANFQDK